MHISKNYALKKWSNQSSQDPEKGVGSPSNFNNYTVKVLYMQFRGSLDGVKILFRLWVGGLPLLSWWVGWRCHCLSGGWVGGATAYLVGGKMNSRIRLTSAKVGVEVEAELGNKITCFQCKKHRN